MAGRVMTDEMTEHPSMEHLRAFVHGLRALSDIAARMSAPPGMPPSVLLREIDGLDARLGGVQASLVEARLAAKPKLEVAR